MIPTLVKKSFRDISRKKARTFFLVLTITLGVMGLSLTAVVPLGNKAVLDKIEQERMHHLEISINDTALNSTVIEGLRSIENVADVEPRVEAHLRMYIGERRAWALFVGIDDMADQRVDRVSLSSGTLPGLGQVLTDEANDLNGVYGGSQGDSFQIIRRDQTRQDIGISGKGKNLMASGETMEGVAVFYAGSDTVRNMTGLAGYNKIVFRLERTDESSMTATIEAIRAYMEEALPVVAFSELPETRPEGYFEGKDTLEQFGDFFMIFTVLILSCSVFLIANTMNTMISEQTREIAQMKAVGATRTDIFRSFLQTSFIIGLMGSVIGAVIGIFTARMVLVEFAKPFGFHPPFEISYVTVVLCMVSGTLIAVIASVPALFKAVRIDILKALGNKGIEAGGSARFIERPLMAVKGIPRSAQMGIRNVNRRPGRSISTLLQIALAVGIIISLTFLGSSVFDAVQGNWKDQRWDLQVFFNAPLEDLVTLTEGADVLGSVPGVSSVEPLIMTDGTLRGETAQIYGMVQDTWSLDYSVTLLERGEGRWWTPQEEEGAANVVVLGYAIAKVTGTALGDEIELMTATGPFTFEVIGIDRTNWDDGLNFRMPITTIQRTLEIGDAIGGFYVRTGSSDHAEIDRTAESILDRLESYRADLDPEIGTHYVLEEEDRVANEGMLNLIFAIGSIIVFISLMGLMSTLTMNILDRTKEIGMLRCLGAGSFSVVQVFSAEGLLLSLSGWIVGIPIGIGLYALLLAMVHDVMNITLYWTFSWPFIGASLIITVVGTILVMLLPLARAVRFRPGEALRYE